MNTCNFRIVGSPGEADDPTTISLYCVPVRPEKVNLASISPDSFGAYSVLVRAAVVHPQELMTFSFIALLPVLVNLYFATAAWSSGAALKLWSVLSKVSWAKAELAHKQNKKGN